MRTLIIILIGFAVWGACIGVAKYFGEPGGASMTVATAVFGVLWFVAAAVNMRLGITKAGYTFKQELPIFLLIFLVPTLTAIVVLWKFL